MLFNSSDTRRHRCCAAVQLFPTLAPAVSLTLSTPFPYCGKAASRLSRKFHARNAFKEKARLRSRCAVITGAAYVGESLNGSRVAVNNEGNNNLKKRSFTLFRNSLSIQIQIQFCSARIEECIVILRHAF